MREEYEIILEKEEREKLLSLFRPFKLEGPVFAKIREKVQNAKVSKYCACGEGLELAQEITNEKCAHCTNIKEENED